MPDSAAARDDVRVFGILNLTEDSFSDGGRYVSFETSLAHADKLIADGADTIDIGAASSHPASRKVSHETEMERLVPVLSSLRARGISISIDSRDPRTQLKCLEIGIDCLNDVDGFRHPALYPDLARASCKLVVMHNASPPKTANRPGPHKPVFDSVCDFFTLRIAALVQAGIDRERIVLDPGMGLFLSPAPEASIEVLRNLAAIRARFDLPLMISVSRKSFLGAVTGRDTATRGAATLAAELFAVDRGASYVRTHDVAALRDALAIRHALGD